MEDGETPNGDPKYPPECRGVAEKRCANVCDSTVSNTDSTVSSTVRSTDTTAPTTLGPSTLGPSTLRNRRRF